MLCGALAAYAVTAETGNPWVGAAGRRGRRWRARRRARVLRPRPRVEPARDRPRDPVPRRSASRRCSARRTSDEIITPFETWDVPVLSSHPVDRRHLLQAGPAHLPLVLRSCPLIWWVLFRTRWGLLLRGAGERPEVLHHLRPPVRRWSSTSPGDRRRHARRHRRGAAVDRLRERLVREHDRRAAASSRSPS